VTFLGLLSPVMATALGWLVLDERLTVAQGVGAVLVLAAVLAPQVKGVSWPLLARAVAHGRY
jgi:probable blue pigment (indigoidine) exporter